MNDFPKEKGLSRALNVEMKKEKKEVQLHPGLLRFYSSTLQLHLKPDFFFFLILSISKSSMLSKYSLIIYQHH